MEAVSGNVYTISIGSTTNKLTIASNNAITLTFGTNTTNSIAVLIGHSDAADTSSNTSFVGANVVDLAYPRSVMIDINSKTNVQSLNGVSYGTLWFPIEVNSSDLSVFKSEADYAMFINIDRSTRFQVKLRDDQGKDLTNRLLLF